MDNHLPQITREIFGKIEDLDIIVVLDEDFVENNIENYVSSLAKNLEQIGITQTRVTINETRYTVSVISKMRNSYRITYHLFTIPKRLEQQIVDQLRKEDYADISERNFEQITGLTISEQLHYLAEIMEMEIQQICELPVDEGWFTLEQWYQHLIDLISDESQKN